MGLLLAALYVRRSVGPGSSLAEVHLLSRYLNIQNEVPSNF